MGQYDSRRYLPQDHEQYASQQSQHKRSMNGLAGLLRTACPQIAGNDDIGSQG